MGGEYVRLEGERMVARKRVDLQGKGRDGATLQRKSMCLVNLRLDATE